MAESNKGVALKLKTTLSDGTPLESNEFIIPAGDQGLGVASMELVYSGTAPSPTRFEIGDLFFSSNSTSPAIRFGGTWTQIKDRFILAAGDTWLAGTEGGSSSHVHTSGTIVAMANEFSASSGAGNWIMKMADTATWTCNYNVDLTGSGPAAPKTSTKGIGTQGQTSQSGNMPPFLAVYVWQKISN